MRDVFEQFPDAGWEWNQTWYPSFWAWKDGDSGGDTVGISAVLSSRIIPAEIMDHSEASSIASAFLDAIRGGLDLHVGLLLGGPSRNDTSINKWMLDGLWHVSGFGHWNASITTDAEQVAIINSTRTFGNHLREIVPQGGAYLNEDDYEVTR